MRRKYKMKKDNVNLMYLLSYVFILIGLRTYTVMNTIFDYTTTSDIKNVLLTVTSTAIYAAWPLLVLIIIFKASTSLIKSLSLKRDEDAVVNYLKEMKILGIIFAAATIGFVIILIVFASEYGKAGGKLNLAILGCWSCFIMANVQWGAVKLFHLLKEKGN
jgi:hypothetical protein